MKGPWDSDYYWHVTTGELIANGQFPRTDPFSFTWGGMPWTLHEWLSELLIFRLVDSIGYMGAVFVFAFVPGIAMGILAFALHRLGLRTAAVVAGTSLSALLVIPYATLRPQALSWIMFAILVGGLVHLRPDRARWILLLPPMFILWANLHGLWVIGLVVLAAYTILSLVGLTPMSGARRWALAMVPLAMLGTAFTPEGPSLILYPLRYVDSGDWGMANISEWQSPDFHDPAHWPLPYLHGRDGDLRPVAGSVVDEHPLVPRDRHDAGRAPERARGGDPRSASARGRDRRRPARLAADPAHAVPAARSPAAGARARHGGHRGDRRRDDPRAARSRGRGGRVDRARAAGPGDRAPAREVPDGRILSWYGWGGYVIGNMYDHGARVFVDGRNDMYDDAILEEYNLVRDAEPGWEEIPDRYGVDAMVFPPFEAISKGPAETAGWCEAFRDDNEVVFLRTCD